MKPALFKRDWHGRYIKQSLMDRFLDAVAPEPNTGCWLFTGYIQPNGYGKLGDGGKMEWLHRIAYRLFKGPIPPKHEPDHLCRVRSCGNPDHLEAVTRRVNILRGASVAARNAIKTHCPQGHPYDEANTARRSQGQRYCKTCNRIRAEKNRNKAGVMA